MDHAPHVGAAAPGLAALERPLYRPLREPQRPPDPIKTDALGEDQGTEEHSGNGRERANPTPAEANEQRERELLKELARATPQTANPGGRPTPNDAERVASPYAEALSRTGKHWLTIQAECLLAGFEATLIDGDDGRPLLVVSRWALTRTFTEPVAAKVWLARVGGAA